MPSNNRFDAVDGTASRKTGLGALQLVPSQAGLTVALFVLILSAACGLCEDQLLSIAVAPDAGHVARALTRNCGATTPYYSFVELRRNSWFSRWQKVYDARGEADLKVSWQDPAHLTIQCFQCTDGLVTSNWDHVEVTLDIKAPEPYILPSQRMPW